jgi:hypothetical protein
VEKNEEQVCGRGKQVVGKDQHQKMDKRRERPGKLTVFYVYYLHSFLFQKPSLHEIKKDFFLRTWYWFYVLKVL